MPTSMRRWRAISAAAGLTSASAVPSIAPPGRGEMNKPILQTRRQFVLSAATATGGLMIGLSVPAHAAGFAKQGWAADNADPREVNAWVVIEPDETVILRCPMAEMGQGTGSGLPMLLAEELECDWSKVKVEFASVNRNIRENTVYGDQLTAGSRGIRTTWPYVQQAGASARARLIQAAATKWNVPATECSASMGKVIHNASGRTFTFGALVADAAKVKLASEPVIKTPEQYKLAGTRQPRLDSRIKSTGEAKFGIDARQQGQ